ncbi:MAG TPA: GMC family oxidoreductase N-terminal domain-containing protein [Gaiellaceae bacterium]|nr:GMC family oxidoreductase N-terminal domain-containing protein [Gaiellaceae bacterium]
MHDYVIVGAGSAGCVVANRLGEDADVKVLVVEAGPPDDDPNIHMPFGFGHNLTSDFDWALFSEPEPGLDHRRNYLPRGRVLGGTSSLNAMIYIRGNRADYDEWAAMGLDGWGYEDVLPYFRRAEDNERGANRYHGAGGPLTVSESRSMHPVVEAFVEACESVGIPRNDDFNGAAQEGAGRFQVTQREGRRCSTAVAYLHPAVQRGNVEVLTEARVYRILFEGTRAVGVEVMRHGKLEQIRAEREVILCAGAYHSPQLLMLSGVGPADALAPVQVACFHDLPVGQNLQDHLMLSFVVFTDRGSLISSATPEAFELYEREGRGPITSNGGEGGAFVRTRDGLEAPDVQFHMGGMLLHEEFLGVPFDDAYTFGPAVVKPSSRGQVTLRSPVPHARPRIIHNYLQTEEDRHSMIEGVRLNFEIHRAPALREWRRDDFLVPASDSEADIIDFVQRRAHTVYHPVGTCAMGSVVDAELRVLGLDGLRVVDASVMPTITRGNTNAATIMIGEKGADLIRGREPLPREQAAEEVGA